MTGTRGPIPKRSIERRRRNKTGDTETVSTLVDVVDVPEADKDWHAIARLWYDSLADSGQSVFYEPSDWATAYLIAESMSRDLSPQFVAVTERGDTVTETIPLKGASLAAYLKAMSVLMVTEGDRRRMRLELERPDAEKVVPASVVAMDAYRKVGG